MFGMDTDDHLPALEAALEARGIRTMRTEPAEPGFVAITMTTFSVDEFLRALAPGPIDAADRLAMRILARGHELGPDEQAWRFVAGAGVRNSESGLDLRVIVFQPESDLVEVVRRLGG
jgi:hypothetical protein